MKSDRIAQAINKSDRSVVMSRRGDGGKGIDVYVDYVAADGDWQSTVVSCQTYEIGAIARQVHAEIDKLKAA